MAIGEEPPAHLPEYIQNLYSQRYGRNGRGRLWHTEHIELAWPDTPLAKWLGEECGGIVIHLRDARLLTSLPGTLTDFRIERLANG